MLPKLDGLSLIQQLRAKGIRSPVLILSAKASVDDRVKGLQAGGDDYLTKPFAFSELLARIQALIRRATQAAEPTRLVVGDLTLDLLTREVQRGGEKIELQPREFALLEYLMRNANRHGHQDHDPRTHLRLQLRSADQRGGRAGAPPAQQGGPRPGDAPHHPGSRLCPSARLKPSGGVSAFG